MNKKILLFSRDPGGANTIIPLVGKLIARGYDVQLYGKDSALLRYRKFRLEGKDIMDSLSGVSIDTVLNFLKECSPGFIITGTSADDFTEKYIWKAAEELNIPTFAVLDQWINYGIRFSDFSVAQLAEYEKDKKHPYIPQKILVMDKCAKEEMSEVGIDRDRILVSGQPYFDFLLDESRKISEQDVELLRGRFGAEEDDIIITYASECLTDTYQEKDGASYYWGYTERTIFVEILKALDKALEGLHKHIKLVVRQHPKEREDNYADLIAMNNNPDISIYVDRETDGWMLMKLSDMVCGMSSMFLIESLVLGRPTISIQIGLTRPNPFVFDRLGKLMSILDQDVLMRRIKDFLRKGYTTSADVGIEYGAADKVIQLMEEEIWRNWR